MGPILKKKKRTDPKFIQRLQLSEKDLENKYYKYFKEIVNKQDE